MTVRKKNYLFSFTDFMYDDIKLVPFTCNHLIGKNISQRFTNGSGEDSQQETGKVIECDSQAISGDFTGYCFDESNLAELDEIPSSFNEVLQLPLITDYLNDDVQLL